MCSRDLRNIPPAPTGSNYEADIHSDYSTTGKSDDPRSAVGGDSDESTDQAPGIDDDGDFDATLQGKTCDNCSPALQETMSRNFLFLHLHYGMYDSPVPAPFIRLGFRLEVEVTEEEGASTSIPSTEFPDSPTAEIILNDKSFDVTLTEEIQPGSTGIVHLGYLACDAPCSIIPPTCARIAVKIGFNHEERRILRREHAIYALLQENGVKGIPKAIGLFKELDQYGDDEFGGPYALIVSHAGDDLHGRAHTLTREAKLSLLSTPMMYFMVISWKEFVHA